MQRVRESDIIVGKPIKWDAYNDKGDLLLRKGCIIESESQLTALIERGLYHAEDWCQPEQGEKAGPSPSPFQILEGVQKHLSCLLHGMTTGLTKDFSLKILNLSSMIQQACERDNDASIGVIFLNSTYPYTIRHPVNVAVVCETITRRMKWTDDERACLLAAALTANIGMIQLQDSLHLQKDPLSQEQRHQVREHPARGVEILLSQGVTHETWLDAVQHHHEALDGSGYPYGLKGEAIPVAARIIAVADHYCAGVSKRSYRQELTPDQAMKDIYLSSGKRIDPDIVTLCVKAIGLYPPGSLVKLANNEIAVVTHRGEKAHTPFVKSIIRANGTLFLNPAKRDCSQEEFKVQELLSSDQEKIAINPCQLWGFGELWGAN